MKANDATDNRPEGGRILDAPHLQVNLMERALQLKQEEAWQKNDRNAVTIFKAEKLSVVLVALHAHALIKDSVINGFLILQVIEGVVKITTDVDNHVLKTGYVFFLHPQINHSIEAVDDALLLLTTQHQ